MCFYVPFLFRKLKKSNISNIPENTFSHLFRLRKLSLAFNDIKTLPSNIFNGLNLLEWLFINSNRLTILPEIGELMNLEWLNISDNFLTLDNEQFNRMDSMIEM